MSLNKYPDKWQAQSTDEFIRKASSEMVEVSAYDGVPLNRMRLAGLFRMGEYVLDGQASRVARAAGQIAAVYDPLHFNYEAYAHAFPDRFRQLDKHSSEVAVKSTVEGVPLFDFGMPDIWEERFYRSHELNLCLQYLDPRRLPKPSYDPVPRPAVTFIAPDGSYDFTHSAHMLLSEISPVNRERLAIITEKLAQVVCAPEAGSRFVTEPQKFCPEINGALAVSA